MKKNWDCAAELLILGDFLKKNRNFIEEGYSFFAAISKLSYYISRKCGFGNSNRNLKT